MSKKWSVFGDRYFLEIMLFGEELIIAEVFEDDGWYFNSSLVSIQDKYLGSDSLEHAKEEVEIFIIDQIRDEIDYNNHLLSVIDDENDTLYHCPLCRSSGFKRSLETRKRISKARREIFKNKELENVINE